MEPKQVVSKPRIDVWAHPDGSKHSSVGPVGCQMCANFRRALKSSDRLRAAAGIKIGYKR